MTDYSTSEEWRKEATFTICDYRNHERFCKWIADPYQADVNNEIDFRWLCEECYQVLCDDI